MRNDAELLRSYADERCEISFAEFVRRHIDVVYHTALRRLNGNTHLAEEVVQSVFIHAARKCRTLARHSAVLGWLHTSTRYAAAEIVRQETRRLAREHAAHLMDSEPTADDSLPWESLRPWLDEALDRLGETDRHAVLLRFFAGRSFAEIGAELRVSEEASRKRVERALEGLRKQLARRGVTTTAAALTAALAATPAVAAPSGLAVTVAATATSAAAGGTLASGFTIFMSTVKLHSATGAAATLAGIALLGTAAFVEISRGQQEERMRLEALSSQIRAERVALARLNRAPAAKTTATDGDTGSQASAKPVIPAGRDAFAAQMLRQRDLLATNPEYRPIRQQELRLRVQREYGAFFAARDYSADKVETLTKALALIYDAEEQEQLAVLKANPSTKVSSDKDLAEENRLIQEKVNDFLGAEEAEKMRRYHLGRRSLMAVRDLSLDLSEVGCPLTPVQEINLATAMGESRDKVCNPNLSQLSKQPDPATGLSGVDQWQIDRARAFLTPEQLRRFENYLRAEQQRASIASRVAGKIRKNAMP
jgi:RNA polymerase sigma factor (sigma-70 family)